MRFYPVNTGISLGMPYRYMSCQHSWIPRLLYRDIRYKYSCTSSQPQECATRTETYFQGLQKPQFRIAFQEAVKTYSTSTILAAAAETPFGGTIRLHLILKSLSINNIVTKNPRGFQDEAKQDEKTLEPQSRILLLVQNLTPSKNCLKNSHPVPTRVA